ncbi:hypothetical protein DEO72_LG7g2008 [Vigna unguiculata]|uniref:Uncharacterized protein n=1 Tax=Vigna unguiculata TaxID=3917 RepID=A0A4D6MI69_VIGUN|nr:hypothetical protein DEO72_LG7g2008 [Vigna unguiculata]
MNLPAHIITCHTPSINLPAHGTTSPDPSKASLSVKTSHTTRNLLHSRLAPQPAPLGETGSDRLAVSAHRQAPALFQRHYFSNTAWRSTPLPPGATQCSDPPYCSYRLAGSAIRQAPYQKHYIAGFGTLLG